MVNSRYLWTAVAGLILGATEVSAAASSGCGKAATLTSGTHTLQVNGKSRQYILRVPDGYSNSKPYKLIFGFHWNTGTMTDVATGQTVTRNVWDYYGLHRLANETAIFVAPQGIENGWWNREDEDLAFTDDMVKAVTSGLCVETTQIFATGFSFGGLFSHQLACNRSETFRAVAILDGAGSPCTNGAQTGALIVHGISDEMIPIASVRTLRDGWADSNKCTKPAQDPPEPAKGSRTHTEYRYQGCAVDSPLWWVVFDGGHIPAPYDGGPGSNGNKAFSPGLTWEFFSLFK